MSRLLFILCICFSFANAQNEIQPSNVRVLLEKDVHEALLEICGPYYIVNPYNGNKLSTGILSKRFMVRPIPIGLKWGQEFPGVHQMLIIPRGKNSKILVNGIQYDGTIAIFKTNNTINIINEIDIESFIKSLLTTRYSSSFPPEEKEALSAIAILARTNVYYHLANNKDSYWQIDAKKINYQGSFLVIDDSNISKAVNDTKDLLLLKNKTIPIEAKWTEHSAGKTASFNNIFRKNTDTSQIGMNVPIAALDRDNTHWKYKISKEKFSNIFNIKKFDDIKLFQEKFSSKVYGLKIISDSMEKDITFFDLQKKLGKKNIQSTDFTISIHDKYVHFDGYGKGHGVGLCSYSCSQMAQRGKNASEILPLFFQETSVVSIKK